MDKFTPKRRSVCFGWLHLGLGNGNGNAEAKGAGAVMQQNAIWVTVTVTGNRHGIFSPMMTAIRPKTIVSILRFDEPAAVPAVSSPPASVAASLT